MTLAPPQAFRKTEGIHRAGLSTAKPAAGDVLVGTLYFSTDTGVLQRSDGLTWASYTGRTGVFNYTFNSTLTAPPSAGQARLNAAFPWTTATTLWLRFVSADDQDLYWGIMIIPTGSTIVMQDKDEHGRYLRMVTTGVPTDQGLYASLPIAWVSNGTTINTASQVFLRVASTGV
jgi:hypothetical protein